MEEDRKIYLNLCSISLLSRFACVFAFNCDSQNINDCFEKYYSFLINDVLTFLFLFYINSLLLVLLQGDEDRIPLAENRNSYIQLTIDD
jgi:hypothetical protein